MQSMLIAVEHPATNLQLQGSLYYATQMVRTAWVEVKAVYARNCFRKVGFVDAPDAEPDASKEDKSIDDLWQHLVSSDMGGWDVGWDNFVSADNNADVMEPCMDDGIAFKVRGISDA
ncbi:hypothetical protein HPB49_021970 [Dermacentor silvarum]|uniref:Uncharacterized protein n=1 Tax=Dermacentor silvarum TaxID=543639 RepID=A0ACB8CZU0_DERSI|nr:hypothetical protein HPB49_021970 [Dermacentor silvarum]